MTDQDPIEGMPQDVKNYYQKAITAFDRKNYDYAIDLLTQALKLKFDFAEARHLLHLSSSRKLKAIPHTPLQNFILSVKHLIPFISAVMSEAKGDLRDSIDRYELILRDQPADKGILERMAKLFLKNHLTQQALFTCEELYELYPKDIFAIRHLGKLYYQRGNIEKSKYFFSLLGKLRPEDFEADKSLRDLEAMKTIEKSYKGQDTGDFRIKTDI